jgi:predicted O-linked N-acetylglucosamine transferase (SPINDLY family)
MTDSPALQLTCAESAVRDSPFDPEHLWRGEAYTHARLRIGYLSADFTEHAVSFLTAAVFEHHDQRRFETFGFALRRDEGSATGRRMRSAFSRLIDVQGMCDADIAERIREAEIDVLVDLMGFTGGYRTGVLAFRPAPVQVNYLGFPGTLGSARADYIIADEFVIPPQHRACYREAIAYMPDCFQANSDRPALAPGAITRAQLGLPQRAFVWCSFHSSYKVNPPLFDIWARLVEAIPESVLWLYAGDDATARNIGTEAARRGMDRQRIVTGGRLPYPMHLARLACADLCLDTWPFNGGATTSDALWAGVPVVTRAGDSFASRMSGSLLRCLGLADLVGESLDEYEQIALDVARRPERLSTLRSQLASAKVLSPPFDSARFCRHLENAYVEMHRQHRSGGRPASFEVAASPRA